MPCLAGLALLSVGLASKAVALLPSTFDAQQSSSLARLAAERSFETLWLVTAAGSARPHCMKLIRKWFWALASGS